MQAPCQSGTLCQPHFKGENQGLPRARAAGQSFCQYFYSFVGLGAQGRRLQTRPLRGPLGLGQGLVPVQRIDQGLLALKLSLLQLRLDALRALVAGTKVAIRSTRRRRQRSQALLPSPLLRPPRLPFLDVGGRLGSARGCEARFQGRAQFLVRARQQEGQLLARVRPGRPGRPPPRPGASSIAPSAACRSRSPTSWRRPAGLRPPGLAPVAPHAWRLPAASWHLAAASPRIGWTALGSPRPAGRAAALKRRRRQRKPAGPASSRLRLLTRRLGRFVDRRQDLELLQLVDQQGAAEAQGLGRGALAAVVLAHGFHNQAPLQPFHLTVEVARPWPRRRRPARAAGARRGSARRARTSPGPAAGCSPARGYCPESGSGSATSRPRG